MIPLLGHMAPVSPAPCACHGEAPAPRAGHCGCAAPPLEGIADWFQAAAPTDAAPLFDCKEPGAVAAYLARSSMSAATQGFAWGAIVGGLMVAGVVVFSRKVGENQREVQRIGRAVAPDLIRAYVKKGM